MCNYEALLNDAAAFGLEVIEKNFKSDARGLCKGKKIGIRKDMPTSEKACVLAEEIGHYKTTVGNILNQDTPNSRKQENAARRWAVDKMLTIDDLFTAGESNCETLYDVAEFLNITEEFLSEALNVFKVRYGISYKKNEKTIIFNDCGFSIIHN